MNYYERIQRSIDFIEANIENEITVEMVAKEAYMSISNFHRMFFALAGYSAKEYIRLRRIGLAAERMKEHKERILDVAVRYSYESADSFSRAFKSVTGYLPSRYSSSPIDYIFERIDLMEKYLGEQEADLLEKYPDIRVLKELEPMRVACYHYYGTDPESHAFDGINAWIRKMGIDLTKDRYRIFGYNYPDSGPDATEYGYEVCITIPHDLEVQEEDIKIKVLEGGLYAVTGVPRGEDLGVNIMKAWQRFTEWIKGSRYVYGGRQWLEEHLDFNENMEHVGGVDLYMPITPKSEIEGNEEIVTVNPMRTVSYTVKGKNAENKARKFLISLAIEHGIEANDLNTRVFAYYNFEQIGKKDFFYTLHISVNNDFTLTKEEQQNEDLHLGKFQGGLYIKRTTTYQHNGQTWFNFMDWMKQNRTYRFGNHWFMEEYLITEYRIDGDTEMALYMPVMEK